MQENNEVKSSDASEPQQFLLFEVDGELYAVLANQVDRVMKVPPITPIPNSPRSIVGIFHLRGKVVVALDLVGRMNMPRNKPLIANYLFVIHYQRNQFAILIDRPKSIVAVAPTSVRPPDPMIAAHVPKQYISGVFPFDEIFPAPKKERTIIIGPAGSRLHDAKPTPVRRPVIWLNFERLLDNDDLSEIVASQRGEV
jgi:purine-binding chemotaxis protein CheW